MTNYNILLTENQEKIVDKAIEDKECATLEIGKDIFETRKNYLQWVIDEKLNSLAERQKKEKLMSLTEEEIEELLSKEQLNK